MRQLLFIFAACGALATARPAALAPEAIVENYWAASREQRELLNGASMDVDIEASLPKLKKHGRLHALRKISSLGRITYEALRFDGDNTVKNNVIARYLAAETESQKEQSPDLALSPANYKFKYRGETRIGDRRTHLFQVSPRKKRVGLFKGEVWIDAATYLRVRESGRFVKNPSIFLKSIAFVREYEIRDGISVPRQVESVIDTRFVGKAELRIDFTNVSLTNSASEQTKSTILAVTDGQ